MNIENMGLNNKPTLKSVAIYARVSTKEQEKGFSISGQIETLKEFAKNMGLLITEDSFYEERGVSGGKGPDKRPELQRLMYNAIIKKKHDTVLVWKIDRFARKTSLLLNLIEELLDNDIGFKSYTENFDFNTSNGKLMLAIYGSMAEGELNNIRIRTMQGKETKSKQNYYTGGGKLLRYGYDFHHDGIGNKLKVNYEEKKVVNRIFRMYVEEDKTIGEIVKILSSERIPTKFDKAFKPGENKRKKSEPGIWNHSTVHSILTNTMVIGKYYYKITKNLYKTSVGNKKDLEKTVAEMNCEKLLDDEMFFYKAQDKLKRNKTERVNKRAHKFAGKIKCGICGSSYHGYKTSKGTISYRCGSRANPIKGLKRCGNIQISERILGNNIWKEFSQIINETDRYLESYYRKTNNLTKIDGLKYDLNELEKEMAKTKNKIEKIYEDLYSQSSDFLIELKEGMIKREEAVYKGLLQRKENTELRIRNLEENRNSKKSIIALAERKRKIINGLDFKGRIKLMKDFIDKIEIQPNGGVDVTFKFEKSVENDSSDSSLYSLPNKVKFSYVISSPTIFFCSNFEGNKRLD